MSEARSETMIDRGMKATTARCIKIDCFGTYNGFNEKKVRRAHHGTVQMFQAEKVDTHKGLA